jgi:hypothetical protein
MLNKEQEDERSVPIELNRNHKVDIIKNKKV